MMMGLQNRQPRTPADAPSEPSPPRERTDTDESFWARPAGRTIRSLLALLAFAAVTLAAQPVFAQSTPLPGGGGGASNPLNLIIILGALAVLPFLLIMVTSFVKVAVVLSLLRKAVGAQKVPPNQVITGLAIVLSLYIMAPVGHDVYVEIKPQIQKITQQKDDGGGDGEGSSLSFTDVKSMGTGVAEPLRRFLTTHTDQEEQQLLYELALQLRDQADADKAGQKKDAGKDDAAGAPDDATDGDPDDANAATDDGTDDDSGGATDDGPDDDTDGGSSDGASNDKPSYSLSNTNLLVLIPAFVVTELKEAFIIGFILFVPFIIIDMVVANILLSLGMHMLSPTTISLPFKLLLFVLVDGWFLVVKGLILGYTPVT